MKRKIVLLAFAIFAVLTSVTPAIAHGKKINIDIKASAPDAAKPLTKLYRALLTFDDGDKVTDAKLTLTASRSAQGVSVGPVRFDKTNEEGVYQASVTYPAYGGWTLQFKVTEPGEGEATFIENLAPPAPLQSDSSSARVSVALVFDAKDALNVGARTIHILAAISWFSIVVMLFVGARVVSREAWTDALARFSRSLPIILAATWGLLIVTGIYLAVNNVPNRAPGIFAPDVVLRLAFGREYLVAFLVKMLVVLGAIVVGVNIDFALRSSNITKERLTRLVALDVVLGLLIFADVVIIGYLHNLSHLGLLQ